MRKNYVQEIILTIVAFIWLLFVATNVNITLGQTYLHFSLGILVLLIIGITIFDKKLHITFAKKEGGIFSAIMWGLAGWIVLLISSIIALKLLDPSQATISAVIGLMGAATPALATSKIANLITFGIAVAYVETQLWGRIMEFFSDIFHININRKSLKTIGLLFIIAILAFIFSVFHLTAKGITNVSALIIVFLMMAISLVMIAYFEETKGAKKPKIYKKWKKKYGLKIKK